MRVLVTGGAGFIGSHVVEHYLAAGCDVAVVDDLSTGHRENVPPDVQLYVCDIRDAALTEVLNEFQPDIINHHAAQMSVRVSIQEPRRDASINVEGTINLLECARGSAVRKVIYASTGGALYGEPRYLPCDEDHPVVPLSHYGISKHTVEHYLELYAQLYGLDYTVLRYPNVYGPRQDPHGEAGVVAIFAGSMLADEPVSIFGDGTQQRDFVYVSDVAKASVSAMTLGSRATVNLGSGKGTSVLDIYTGLANVLNYHRRPIFRRPRLGEVYRIYLTGTRARRQLEWTPEVSLEAGLARTVAALRAAGARPVTEAPSAAL